jgi:amino acid transporter
VNISWVPMIIGLLLMVGCVFALKNLDTMTQVFHRGADQSNRAAKKLDPDFVPNEAQDRMNLAIPFGGGIALGFMIAVLSFLGIMPG